ncbi:hypothetical protein LWM68_00930 [Niabella sp. W65]|nr:hypothetical protein [Niabella sp. W65]MCH7361470.1 hypothetical protein [Niabella sp. W65]
MKKIIFVMAGIAGFLSVQLFSCNQKEHSVARLKSHLISQVSDFESYLTDSMQTLLSHPAEPQQLVTVFKNLRIQYKNSNGQLSITCPQLPVL